MNIICTFFQIWECHYSAPFQFLAHGVISEKDLKLVYIFIIYNVEIESVPEATVRFKSLRIVYVAIPTLIVSKRGCLITGRHILQTSWLIHSLFSPKVSNIDFI